jgi:hypothetical protein
MFSILLIATDDRREVLSVRTRIGATSAGATGAGASDRSPFRGRRSGAFRS